MAGYLLILVIIKILTILEIIKVSSTITVSNTTSTEECYTVTENKNPQGPLVPCSFLDTRFVECLRLISKNQTKVGI